MFFRVIRCGRSLNAALYAVVLAFAPAALAQGFSFAIVPQQPATELARNWQPLLKYLSEKSGRQLVFQTAKDIPTFEARVASGAYDFIYVSPYTYTAVSRRAGGPYRAFAKERGVQLKGIVVVRRDSGVNRLTDLRGKTLAFPTSGAVGASLIPRAQLAAQGIEIKPIYVSSHNSVYLAVARGIYPAGGGVERTLAAQPEEVRSALRVLWTTPGYTPHPFAAHRRVPRAAIDAVRRAMLAMQDDAAGKAILARLNFKGFESATDAQYNDHRALRARLTRADARQ